MPSQGLKSELIARILNHDPDYAERMESPKMEAKSMPALPEPSGAASFDPSQMMNMMMLMLQQQEASRVEERKQQESQLRRQEEREERLMQMISNQNLAAADLAATSRSSGIDRVGQDPQAISERFAWFFADLEWKMKRLQDDMEKKAALTVCRRSLAVVEQCEEKLCALVGEKLQHLSDTESQDVTSKYEDARSQVDYLRREALEHCRQQEEQEKASGLPAGVQVPEFNGDPNKFPVWLESFQALIHSNVKVSTFYKYSYLRQALKGEASSCLDGFSPMAESYAAALEHVKKRFGQPRKVVRHVVRSIVDMQALASNSAKEVRAHFDMVHGKLLTLKKYTEELTNPVEAILIPILESKLSGDLRQEWEKELVENIKEDEFASFDRFTEWYMKQARAREVSESFKDASSKKTDGKAQKSSSEKNGKPFFWTSVTCRGCWTFAIQ